MYIRFVSFTNFRLYSRLELNVSPGVNIFEGDNAQGKTSLLEGIYLLANGRLPLTENKRHVIRWGSEQDIPFPYAILRAGAQRKDQFLVAEVRLQIAEGDRLLAKTCLNHLPCRISTLRNNMRVVLFLPQDVQMVAGAPALRREFLDIVLSQISYEYAQALEHYQRALAHRNAFLRTLQYKKHPPYLDAMAVFDQQLITAGAAIMRWRSTAIQSLNQYAPSIHHALSNRVEQLRLVYHPSFSIPHLHEADDEPASPIASDASAPIAGAHYGQQQPVDQGALELHFKQTLAQRYKEELARGMTLVGPHRDDVRFLCDGVDLGTFGSRGQQRTAALAVKLAQVAWLQAHNGDTPVVLLDDVFSELDPHRARCLLDYVSRCEQALITTTNVAPIEPYLPPHVKRFCIHHGVVRPHDARPHDER